MSKKSKLSSWIQIFKQTASEFSADNATKLAAALSYYTVFSIGPLILVIISSVGLFFETTRITQSVYNQISGMMGNDAAKQILEISNNMRVEQKASIFTIIGVVSLIIGATGIFAEIQDSINYIWSIKAKPKQGWLKYLKTRVLSFSLILSMGFLLLVSLLINTVVDLLTQRLARLFGDANVFLFKGVNYLILFTIITLLFTLIYKVLPDARIRWRDTVVGAAFTGLLFLLGKYGIGLYLGNSSTANTYGAAASVILLLLWVYYSAMILYFGAEFTKVYALHKGEGIRPLPHAVFIEKREIKELPNHPDEEKDKELEGEEVPIIRTHRS